MAAFCLALAFGSSGLVAQPATKAVSDAVMSRCLIFIMWSLETMMGLRGLLTLRTQSLLPLNQNPQREL
jgi:hypothetical protein